MDAQETTTVPLVMYHDDRRIVIGTATVDKAGFVKGHVGRPAEHLTEIVATVFKFG